MPLDARTAILVKQAMRNNQTTISQSLTSSNNLKLTASDTELVNIPGVNHDTTTTFSQNLFSSNSIEFTAVDTDLVNITDENLDIMGDSNTIYQNFSSSNNLKFTAFVTDIQEWLNVTEVNQGSEIKLAKEDSKYLVTGTIDPRDVETIEQLPFVSNIQIARLLSVCAILEDIKEDVDINYFDQFLSEFQNQNVVYGEGVVIGIIDDGADFNHPNFKNGDGTSRIECIWDQSYNDGPPIGDDIKYGRVIGKDEIDRVILDDTIIDKYSELQYDPGVGSHGTHVMDIAAGKNGLAPKSSIIFVDLPWTSTNGELHNNIKEHLASSNEVIDAISFITKKAGNRPCVINMSFGESAGPHDGTSDVDAAIESFLFENKNRAVIVAGGNYGSKRLHKSGKLQENQSTIIEWHNIHQETDEFDMIEIRYPKTDTFEVEVSFEDIFFPLNLSDDQELDEDGNNFATAKHNQSGDDNLVYISRKTNICTGTWSIKLTGKTVQNGEYHAYIEYPCGNHKSSTIIDATTDCTLNALATTPSSIVVGCYKKNPKGYSHFSSAGPTRTGLFKPEVSSLGEDIWAACSKSTNISKRVKYSGTSQSAPVIAGITARILSIARGKNKELSTSDIQHILINSASLEGLVIKEEDIKKDENGRKWHPRYGFGRIIPKFLEDNLLQ